jgi:hypothetical protein
MTTLSLATRHREEIRMATTDEIRHRIEEADTARSAKRAAAAQQVGELAQRRTALAEQLAEIERELGDVLAATSDVIGVNELSRFTDVPAADLTRWLDGRRTTRVKRRKPGVDIPTRKSDTPGDGDASTQVTATAR